MKTLDISGFGGGYEKACQTMLTRGLKWGSEHVVGELKYQGYEGVFGLLMAKGNAAKDLDRAILADRIDATGAMHQAVVENLMFIFNRGYVAWLQEGRPDGQVEIDDPEREAAVKKLEEKKT
jgi:hypothetical protein